MNLNKVYLGGRLTKDVEIKYPPSGTAIGSFGMAVNKVWHNKDKQKQEDVCYVNLTAFGRTAENISEYFKKGSEIFIEGELKFSQWEDKDGKKRSDLKVNVTGFQFCGGSKKSGQESSVEYGSYEEIPF